MLVTVAVVVLVTVSVTVGGAIVEVVDELELVLEPEDQRGVPTGSAARDPPMTISSFCRPEFWRFPCTPHDAP